METVKNLPCFDTVSEKLTDQILDVSVINKVRMERAICYQDDMPDKVFLLVEGRLKKIRWRDESNSVVTGQFYSGDWIGLPEAVSDMPYLFDAITEEECLVLFIDKQHFDNLMNIPEFMRIINKELARGYYSIYAEMDTHTALQKIVRYIKTYVDTFDVLDKESNNPIIDITQENLAYSIGITRETVGKYLRLLQDNGAIINARGRIEVIDISKLDLNE